MPGEAFLTMPETDDRRKWWILANVSVGTFMATLDGSIANVGLPTISVALHVPLHTVQWVITVYLLTICAILPIVGKLADLFGRGRLYNIGFLIFSGGSALCAVSGSIGVLIGARILQALGASLLMANSQAIVTTTFPANQRGRALGITGTMVSLGSLTGPALGGLLIGWFGWSSIFWINVPIGILTEVRPILFMDALHVVFWAAAAVCVTGALLSALRPKRSGPSATLAPAAP